MWSRLPSTAPKAAAQRFSTQHCWLLGSGHSLCGVNPHMEGHLEASLALTHEVPGAPLHHKCRMFPDSHRYPVLPSGTMAALLNLLCVCVFTQNLTSTQVYMVVYPILHLGNLYSSFCFSLRIVISKPSQTPPFLRGAKCPLSGALDFLDHG